MDSQGRSKGDSLRKRAEKILSQGSKAVRKIPVEDIKRLIHELDVYQIELDMQNDELRKAQAEIELSRTKYVDLYDFAPIGYFSFNQTGVILEANLTGAKMLGVERSILLGHPFISFVSPDCRNTFHLHMGRVFSTGTKETCELKIVEQNGASFYASLESISMKGEGNPIQCRSAIIDITERRQSEEVLMASETRYRRLFETAQDGILILDADTGQISDVNPFLVQMLGYSHEDFLGKNLWEIGAFKDIEASKAAFLELQTKGYVRYADLPLETRDGRHIDVEFVSNVYLVNSQKVIQCDIRDITAHKHAEELVIKSLDQVQQVKLEWESTVDSLLQLIFLLDEQGHILRANRTVEAWNLGKVGVVHGMEMHTLFHPGCTDQGCYLETLWPQARGKLVQGESVDRELEDSILRRHLSIQIRPIFARKNGLRIKADSFAVAIFWDITRRKRIEEERERLIHELQDALAKIKRLRGLLPMCASCKKIRDDKGYWNDVEAYISEHSEAEFTHGVCPDCMKKLYGIFLDKDGNFHKE
jgi:PAS domain S-box-containing protein